MTKQEIFNTVSAHLLKQNERSWDWANNICRYRNTEGMSCAVGCLLDDETAHAMDEATITSYEGDVVSLSHMLPPDLVEHIGLLESLQLIHDDELVECWPKALEILATQSGLTP